MAEGKKIEDGHEEQGSQEKDQPRRKKFPVNLVIICILVLTLFGGGFFVWKDALLKGLFNPDKSSIESSTHKKGIGPIYPLNTFIVNLLGGRGKNYLKVKIDLELSNKAASSEIDKRLPQFRDAIITLLSSKSNGDINTPEGKFQLRAEIISTLNQYLSSGKIRDVYFTDFIIQ